MFLRDGICQTTKGDALPGYYIECVASGVAQTIYADASSTPIESVSGVANRAKADVRGNYSYFVADGNYYEKYYDKQGVFQFQRGPFSMVGLDSIEAVANSATESATYAARASAISMALPNKFLSRRVMSSPPTPTYSSGGSHTMGSYTFIPAADGTVISSSFNYRKCSKVTALNGNVSGKSVSNGLTAGALDTSHLSSFAFTYDAQTLELQFSNNSQNLWFKIDGEYVSLTPQALTSGGAGGIVYFDFGSAKMREIEVILAGVGAELRFTGAYIEPTASVAPIAPRGPKVIVLGDSFGEGTGATSAINSYAAVLGDTLGWDNVISSSTGGTGLLGTSSGTKLTYRQRFALDVAPFEPDIIIIQGSINDGTQTPAAVSTELQLLIAEIEAALPYCKIIVTSMMASAGGGFASYGFYTAAEGMKLGAEAVGVSFVNLLEQDLPTQAPATPLSGTITRTAAINATRIYTNVKMARGTTLKFADGAHFRVTLGTDSGAGDYICDGDRTYCARAVNDAFTVVGNSAWSGNGKVGATTGNGNCDRVVSSDGTHPSDDGHIMIGTGIAYGVAKALATT